MNRGSASAAALMAAPVSVQPAGPLDPMGRRCLAPVLRPESGQVGQAMTSARQLGPNPVGSFVYAHFGQDTDIITQNQLNLASSVS
jgi:hypothetical protein